MRSRSGFRTGLSESERELQPSDAARLVLASTSPQRRAILAQLGIPFELLTPSYQERPGGDPLVHAAGKARSVDGGGQPVLGVDTIVLCEGHTRIPEPA